MPGRYTREQLAAAVAGASTWAGVMRALGLRISGGQRRTLQKAVAEYGLDTAHFVRRSPWLRYPDDAIAQAVETSTTLREVVDKLGARPATGTLSHIRRRIAAAGMDVRHFPALDRPTCELPFTDEELKEAAASASSLRSLARTLGVPDDGRSRAVLRRMLHAAGADVSHFSHARLALPDDALRQAVLCSRHYAEVLRALRLPVDEVNRRRVQRRVGQLGLDTGHFVRRSRRPAEGALPKQSAAAVLRLRPEGSPRTRHDRLRRALDEVGVPYACSRCDNRGAWEGAPLTLQIDHINGDWRDNRRHNLRYLCPNCHAITDTWCGRNRGRGSRSPGRPRQ